MAQTSTKTTNPPKTYSFLDRERLWMKAGGSTYLAPIMAAISMAENPSGKTTPTREPDGSYSTGLWQINSANTKTVGKPSADPQQNARQALTIYNRQGLNAWTTFKTGAYLKPLREAGVIKKGDAAKTDKFLKKYPTADSLRTHSTDWIAATAHSAGIGSGKGVVDKATQTGQEALGGVGGGIESAVLLGLKEAMYGVAILGGGMLILLGLLFIGVDVGLSSLSRRASSHPVIKLANKATTRKPSSGGPTVVDNTGGNLPGPEA